MKKLLTAFALLFALTLTACSDGTVIDIAPDSKTASETAVPTEAPSITADFQSAKADVGEPFVPNSKYYRLPDGTVYSAPNDGEMFLLGYAFVRENTDMPDDKAKWHRLDSTDEWNGLWVKFAQSGGWTAYSSYRDAVFANNTVDTAHHQTINFLGEKTFTGKAGIIYAADGETPAYTAFYLDEEISREMPVFSNCYETDNGYQTVFFTLYHEDFEDKCEEVFDLLLEGKEVTVSITTNDFMWEYSDYGLVVDGKTRGHFNTILSFDISVN